MNGHATSRNSLTYEEKMGLLEDKTSSDSDSESSTIDLDGQFKKIPQWLPFITAPVIYLRSIHWKNLLLHFLWFLVPSFLQGRHMREQIRPAKLGPTAYLDGMRGLAALFVYFCHYSYQAFTIAESYGCGENNYHIFKLPFLRLWYQGPVAVCVFFVISGYALTYRPLKLIRSRAWPDFSTTMSSLIFRRAIRLYLPTAISTMMIICLLRIGAYEWTRPFATDRMYHKNVMEPHPARMESAYEQWWDWAWDMFKFVHVWNWEPHGGTTHYDVHLWTIPIEYRCSLYLFLVIFGTARLQTRLRFLAVIGVMWFTYRNSRWEFLLFLAGMLIAEMDHIRGAHVPPPALPQEEKQQPCSRGKIMPVFWAIVSIFSLYLMSQPDGRGDVTPGWIYLTSLIPKWWEAEQYRYWQSVGAIVFIIAVGHSPRWQRFFNTGVVQYFGKISYAIYLMHGPAMHTMGYHWEKWAYSWTGVEGYWYNAGFFLGAAFCVPTVVWWADVFWRAVDIPTVKFAKWFESKCVYKS